jgi:hypothetical protein
MLVQAIEIENFRSFRDSQTLQLYPGFNILLGANNSGKSTVLSALDLNQLSDPTMATKRRASPSLGWTLGHVLPNSGDFPDNQRSSYRCHRSTWLKRCVANN